MSFEVPGYDACVVKIVMVDPILIVVGVAAIDYCGIFLDRGAVVEEIPCGCQRMHSSNVFHMSVEVVISETISFARTAGSPPNTYRTVWVVVWHHK
jgi:hypothetical protein